MARRLKGMGQEKYKNAFRLTLHPEDLEEPKKWRKSHNIFVCSMGDLFHDEVPFDFVDRVMQTIRETPWHRYQILTKRAEQMEEYFTTHKIPSNVWLGVTVEVKRTKARIDHLRNLNASVRFLSCEPLLEDLGNMNLDGIDWIIVGGESGTQARLMSEEWVLNIKHQAEQAGIAFFFKQWGTWSREGVKRNKHVNGKMLEGKVIQQMPTEKRRLI
jgi:protein gp37